MDVRSTPIDRQHAALAITFRKLRCNQKLRAVIAGRIGPDVSASHDSASKRLSILGEIEKHNPFI